MLLKPHNVEWIYKLNADADADAQLYVKASNTFSTFTDKFVSHSKMWTIHKLLDILLQQVVMYLIMKYVYE